jgi:hypothetical protein
MDEKSNGMKKSFDTEGNCALLCEKAVTKTAEPLKTLSESRREL